MIKAENLTKTFRLTRRQMKEKGSDVEGRELRAVDQVSFSCSPGRVFTLLGPNGAGKTTTLRIIATLMNRSVISVTGWGWKNCSNVDP